MYPDGVIQLRAVILVNEFTFGAQLMFANEHMEGSQRERFFDHGWGLRTGVRSKLYFQSFDVVAS